MSISRVEVTMAVMLIAFAAAGARILQLAIFEKDFLQGHGDARSVRTERINVHRGIIEDRNGNPLAVSSPVVSFWADPGEVMAGTREQRAALATALGVSLATFDDGMTRNLQRSFVYVRRQMAPPEAAHIQALKTPGIYTQKEYHRYYPAGEVAAHFVGITDIDDAGQEGIELSFDKWLAGTPGRKQVLKNLYGDVVRDVKPLLDARPGRNMNVSLDLRMQYLAYRELKSAIRHHGAESGSVVILDVTNGQVLAMVNQPSYNPNNRSVMEPATLRNRAVTDVFEPGSTVKPFTVAVALESGGFTADSVIDTNPGFVRVAGKVIRDPSNRGAMDLGSIVAHSSQVGISKLALSIDEFDVWRMFHEVGFGQAPGTGFPGESSGYLPNYRKWKDIDRVTLAYGYGLNLTPLQLASAYLTIASGGIRRQVSMLDTADHEGERVMSERVAAQIRAMLRRVVTEGTGKRAAIDAYAVAGKTGTVRKIGKDGYEDTHHLTFFAGMTPAKEPRLVGLVLINDPEGESSGGGTIAAPLFSRVMEGALRLLYVPPQTGGAA
jgi:cell division protein FtsI (penicillin-binding protein 3)